jgi:hypothetical protein
MNGGGRMDDKYKNLVNEYVYKNNRPSSVAASNTTEKHSPRHGMKPIHYTISLLN